jgi:hypothetical protein
LLAVCTVLATGSSNSSDGISKSKNIENNSGSDGSSGAATSSSSVSAVAGVARVGLRVALEEAWRRPGAVGQLDGPQLTSLCVVLQRACRRGGLVPPPALMQAAWSRLAALARQQLPKWQQGQGQQEVAAAEGEALSPQELAVCLACLAAHPGAPPPRLLSPALAAAAAALPRLDAAGLWRVAAAGCAWEPQLRGRPPQQARLLAASLAREAAARAGRLDAGALATAAQLSAAWLWPGAPARVQLAAALGRRIQQQQTAAAAAASGGDGEAAAGLELTRAAGWLVADWAEQGEEALRQLCVTLLPPGTPGAAAAAAFFLTAAAQAGGRGASALDAALARLMESQQLGSSGASSPEALCAAATALACCSRHTFWPDRADALAGTLVSAAEAGTLPVAAACTTAAALCAVTPPGWQERTRALQAACLSPQQLAGAPAQALVDLALAAGEASGLRDAAFGALAARSSDGRLAALRLPELLVVAAREGRRAANAASSAAPPAAAGAWAGAARAALGVLQHRARFLPPHELLQLLRGLGLLGLAPEGMITAAGLQIASCVGAMAPEQLAEAALAFQRLGAAPPRAPSALAGEAARLMAGGRMGAAAALGVLAPLARLRTGGRAARRLLNLLADVLLDGTVPVTPPADEPAAEGSGGGGVSPEGQAGADAGSSASSGGAPAAAVADVDGAQGLLLDSSAPSTLPLAPLRDLARVIWAAGALGASPVRFKELLVAVTVHPERPDPRALSGVVWACARLRRRVARPEGIVAWAVRSGEGRWSEAPAYALANTTWGLWKLGECAGPLRRGPLALEGPPERQSTAPGIVAPVRCSNPFTTAPAAFACRTC